MNVEIYNPHKKDESELPFIYGFNNRGEAKSWCAQLIAEDGTPLEGSHIFSHEYFMPREHYPDGYRLADNLISEEDYYSDFRKEK